MDFGHSVARNSNGTFEIDQPRGTKGFQAPEVQSVQLGVPTTVTAAADVYAFCVTAQKTLLIQPTGRLSCFKGLDDSLIDSLHPYSDVDSRLPLDTIRTALKSAVVAVDKTDEQMWRPIDAEDDEDAIDEAPDDYDREDDDGDDGDDF